MLKKIISYFIATLFSCAYAQDAESFDGDDFASDSVNEEQLYTGQGDKENDIGESESNYADSDVVDMDDEGEEDGTQTVSLSEKKEKIVVDDFTGDSANEELLDADQSDNESEAIEANIEGDNVGVQIVPFSEDIIHFGGRIRLGGAALCKSYGATGAAGIALNYFFYKKFAIQTGINFQALVLRNFGEKSKEMYDVSREYEYGWQDGLESHSVKNYTISFIGVSFPLALRVGDRFWSEFGIQFDYVAGRTDYTIPPELEPYKENLRDPFKPKTTLYSNLLAGFGINMPMGNWYLDLGLQATVGLNKIETDYETTEYPLFSIGVYIAYWR